MKRRLLNYFSPHRLASHRFYFWAHTDHTDLTVFALVGGKSHRCFAFVDGFRLTRILLLGSHRSHRSHSFCFSGWEISQMLSAGLLQWLTRIQQIQQIQLLLRNLFNPLNLCEIYYNDSVRSVGSV